MLLAKQAIRSKFDTFTGCSVKHQNEAFEANPLNPFINYYIDGSSSYQSGIGTSQYTIDYGILFITAYIQSGIGDYDVSSLLEQAASLFSGKRLNTSSDLKYIEFDRYSFGGSGNGDEDGVWYMESISIPFRLIGPLTGA